MGDVVLAVAGSLVLFLLFIDVSVSLYASWMFFRLRSVQAALLRELLRTARIERRAEKNRSE